MNKKLLSNIVLIGMLALSFGGSFKLNEYLKEDSSSVAYASELNKYTVKPDDTLFKISKEYDTTVEALVSSNSILNKDLIYPEDTIIIPDQSYVVPVTEPVVEESVVTEVPVVEAVEVVPVEEPAPVANSGKYGSALEEWQLNMLYAIVRQEGGESYTSALAVTTAITNRVDSGRFGSNVYSVIVAPGQFEAYLSGHYTKYLGNVSSEVKQAVNDALNGTKSHNYLFFWSASYAASQGRSGVNIGGNVYFNM